MAPTAFFTGANGDGAEVAPARQVASKLVSASNDAAGRDFGLLFSAAAYVIRDGREPTDGRVIEEAKRRLRLAEQARPR